MQQNTASLSKILNFALCTRSWYAFLVCYTWRRWSIFARNWVLANTLHLTRILGVFHMDSCPLYVWPTTLCMLLLHGSYPPNMVSFPEMINMLNLDILYEVKGRLIWRLGMSLYLPVCLSVYLSVWPSTTYYQRLYCRYNFRKNSYGRSLQKVVNQTWILRKSAQ